MNDRLSQTYNPVPLDRNVARQSQMYVVAAKRIKAKIGS
jgi:hypothetical protein